MKAPPCAICFLRFTNHGLLIVRVRLAPSWIRQGESWRLVRMENGPAKTERSRRSRAEIAELIGTYRQSGQKQREFCQQRGIGLSTLQNDLRRERSNGQAKQRLLEVEVVSKATAGRSQALEIIGPNGYRIMVVARFEAEDLLRLLQVLEQIKATGL